MTSNEKSAVTFYENEMERAKRNIATIVKNSANLTEVEFSNAISEQLVHYDEARVYKDSIITFAKCRKKVAIKGGIYVSD